MLFNAILDFISEALPQEVEWSDDNRNQNGANAMLFFRLKNDDWSFSVKLVNIVETTQNDLLCKYWETLNKKIQSLQTDEVEIKHIDEYDYTNNKQIYYFNEWEVDEELSFLKLDYIHEEDEFHINDLSKVNWIIVRIWNTRIFINLYIPYFPIYSLARNKWIVLREATGIWNIDTQFVSNEADKIIRFNYNIAFLYFSNKLLIFDFKKLEKNFKYLSKMTERATVKLWILETKWLLSANSTIATLIESNPSLVNKLLKIRETSPVFDVPKIDLVNFVRLPDNKFKIKISDTWEFEVNTLAKARIFLKIIDDDYVKSELTGVKYDAEKKNDIIDSE